MDTDKYLYNRKTHKNEMNGSSLLNIGIIGLVGEQHLLLIKITQIARKP